MRLRILVAAFAGVALCAQASFGAGFVINNNNAAGEGFNDPTARTSDIDGQPTTLGQDRLDCLAAAAQIWANLIASDVTIVIDAEFNDLGGNEFGAPLGFAGPITSVRDFSGTPVGNMWFSIAQGNQLAGSDLNSGNTEIFSGFNSAVDGPVVLGSTTWYYGIDGNVPFNKIDFLSTALHEIGHGLGFLTFMNVQNGQLQDGRMDIYTNQLRRAGITNLNYSAMNDAQRQAANISGEVVWKGSAVVAEQGGNEPMYTPNPLQQGSSVSHWDTTASPNLLMEPSATEAFTALTLEVQAFEDLLWPFAADPLDPNNVFVDFDFNGIETGAAANPFSTLAAAIAAANPNADINMEPSTSSETFTDANAIDQALTLRNNNPGGGSVIIGN